MGRVVLYSGAGADMYGPLLQDQVGILSRVNSGQPGNALRG